MSYKDATQYEEDHTFTDVELGQITPEHLKQWMCFKAYGPCDIHEVYGPQLSVSSIINHMRRDRANGGHPALRIANL